MPLRMVKLIFLGLFFFSGCLSITFNQLLFLTWFRFAKDEKQLDSLLEYTKRSFLILLAFCTSVFSSSTEIELSFRNRRLLEEHVTFDRDNNGKPEGNPRLNFDKKAVVISNHQIYSDWFFLWFIAYLNDCAEHFFIVMKDSLKKIPILGYGMTNYNFIFLSRNWENDKDYMKRQFHKIVTLNCHKFWLLIFPEGTNMSHNNRTKSHRFANKMNLPHNQCVLLPRAKGLYVACKELSPATTKVLDFTIAYSQHSKDEMAQDIFTLWKIYILGESPRLISILADEHDLKEQVPEIDFAKPDALTPAQEEAEIGVLGNWINDKWQTKESDMNYYYVNGTFDVPKDATVTIPLRLNSSWEIIQVYIPSLTIAAGVAAVIAARWFIQ